MTGYGCLIFEHNFKAREVERRETGALGSGETDEVFFSGDEGFSALAGAKFEKCVEVCVGICVVVAEGRSCGEVDSAGAE